jgi:hypothetical protein
MILPKPGDKGSLYIQQISKPDSRIKLNAKECVAAPLIIVRGAATCHAAAAAQQQERTSLAATPHTAGCA